VGSQHSPGTLLFDYGVLISPGGKPVLLGVIQGKPVVGIPGPPHAAIVVTEQLLPPLLEKYLRNPCNARPEVQAVLREDFKIRPNNEWFNRVHVSWNGKGYEVYPLKEMGDTVENFVDASGIVRISSTKGHYKKGENVGVELLCEEKIIKQKSLV
jgi:molybdopterin biosynthesis enzyme